MKDENRIEDLRAYNEALEQSLEYQRILTEVMNEVYSLYVNERIESLESLAETEGFLAMIAISLTMIYRGSKRPLSERWISLRF